MAECGRRRRPGGLQVGRCDCHRHRRRPRAGPAGGAGPASAPRPVPVRSMPARSLGVAPAPSRSRQAAFKLRLPRDCKCRSAQAPTKSSKLQVDRRAGTAGYPGQRTEPRRHVVACIRGAIFKLLAGKIRRWLLVPVVSWSRSMPIALPVEVRIVTVTSKSDRKDAEQARSSDRAARPSEQAICTVLAVVVLGPTMPPGQGEWTCLF
jgi:hypothetical protein